MKKQFLSFVVMMSMLLCHAFAKVEVNTADATALTNVKGLGPVMSTHIIEERTTHGEFIDWMDFESRVKGIGSKNALSLSAAGLQVNGQHHPKMDLNVLPNLLSQTGEKIESAQ